MNEYVEFDVPNAEVRSYYRKYGPPVITRAVQSGRMVLVYRKETLKGLAGSADEGGQDSAAGDEASASAAETKPVSEASEAPPIVEPVHEEVTPAEGEARKEGIQLSCADLYTMKKDELLALAASNNIRVVGTGAGGAILRKDLINALRTNK